MDNKKIVIDAGHGGDDPGSVGNGIIEKDLNLKISQYMYQRFKDLGIPVKMTRTTDETLPPDERVKRVLDAYGNSPDVVVISNHINAGGGDGAEVIYALRNTSILPDLILEKLADAGQNTRDAYQRRLPGDTSKDYYFMQRDTGNTQAINIEYGFLDSPDDDVQQLKNNWQQYAEAVVKAVVDYIKGQYVPGITENVYVVKSGDSLWTIAKKYGISVTELKNYNNLTSNLLTIGQQLRIPIPVTTPSAEYRIYTVMPGDTLYSIARNNNITTDELLKFNNLTSSSLAVGQQLKIPTTIPTTANYITYTVKSGDNLYDLANKYNTTVNDIKALNNLSSTLLNIGQTLKIPTTPTSPNYINYTVKSGDNLYSIAQKYNTNVQQLMTYNNLTSSLLSLGQVIKIPTSTSTITYTVQSGDNLYDIANKYNTTVDEIKRKNNLTSNLLNIGQVLTI